MSMILDQKQIANTLQNKVSKNIFSENRAFDRRVILDKNTQIWKEIMSIPCNFINQEETSVLKVEGETAKVLGNWRPVSGTPNLIEFNSESQKVQKLKQKCQQKVGELKGLRSQLTAMMKNTKE